MNSPIVTRRQAQKAKIQTRAMIKSNAVSNRKPNAALLEAKRKAKLLKMQEAAQADQQQDFVVKDIFQNALLARTMLPKPTGLVYDETMTQHRCLWYDKHPECPERLTRVLERCRELNLIDSCVPIPSRRATKDEILLLHSEEHFNMLEETSKMDDETKLEDLSSHFDSIYLHPSTFDLSLLAVGSTIDLVEQIVNGNIQNGMAIIRPPGHHAMKAEYNGYCFFNNVAIAAQYALDILKLKKIMIVDWDVHHGQGIQRFFYQDPRVLYFSIHRFEHGTYWPNLKESDYDAIGYGDGVGYNFNVPLNRTGMGNGDYLAIFQQILIPVAVEFQPELIIISAGFDAALGCPEGEMEVTPALYPHLINPLLKMAESRVAVVLEGGYCLESLAEGAALTLRTLIGLPCPKLVEKVKQPCVEIQDTIMNCIHAHRQYWKCLQVQNTYTMEELNNVNPQSNLHKVTRNFIGGPPLPARFPTRDVAPQLPVEFYERSLEWLKHLKAETKLEAAKLRVCYVYDEEMMQHSNLYDEAHPEQPGRVKRIYEMHQEFNLLSRMERLSSRFATTDEICLAHTRSHVNLIRRLNEKDELGVAASKFKSVYFHPKTFHCATLASGSVLQVVDKVLKGEARSGVCIVRPPGHHAMTEAPEGFCIFNNVAIAAQYAIREFNLKRVLIVDWDVHHGNGTQQIFESNPKVLYISIHRYDNMTFFPRVRESNYDFIGKGAGVGFNVNIPWNKKGMGDFEYSLAFQQLVMPIAYEFDPELVLISAGFDAAIGDPLGGCKVTPEAYGLFTHWLTSLANGRVIMCLEGGYNFQSISYAMTMCTKSLLGDPLPPVQQVYGNASKPHTAAYQNCLETLRTCLDIQTQFWKSLAFNKRLPEANGVSDTTGSCSHFPAAATSDDNRAIGLGVGINNNEDFLSATMENLIISQDDAASVSLEASGSKPKVKVKTFTEFLTENLEALQNNEMFAVVPLKTCPHLTNENLYPMVDQITLDTTRPCEDCSSAVENWICLCCLKVFCGRYIKEHMLMHNITTSHPLALSFSDLSVWCYACESYIDNQKLYAYKNLAHRHKFGHDMIWPYINQPDDDDDHDGGLGGANGADDKIYLELDPSASEHK